MARKMIDRIIYHITTKPSRYQSVKDPPKTSWGKLLHPQKARQEQYNRWCEHFKRSSKKPSNNSRNSLRISTTKPKYIKEKYGNSPQNTVSKPHFSLRENLLLREMKRKNLNFSLQDIIFITKDRTGQLVWLEKGNARAGLMHILDGDGVRSKGHASDFKNVFGVERNEISMLLKNIMRYGKNIHQRIKMINGREGFEKIVLYKRKYYILSGIGKNGFIVSAYPINKKRAEKTMEEKGV